MSRTLEYRFEGNERPLLGSISRLRSALGGLDSEFEDIDGQIENSFDGSALDSFRSTFDQLQGALQSFGFDADFGFDLGPIMGLRDQLESLVDIDVDSAIRDSGSAAEVAESGFSGLKLAAANAAGSFVGAEGAASTFAGKMLELGNVTGAFFEIIQTIPGVTNKRAAKLANLASSFGLINRGAAAASGALMTMVGSLVALGAVVTGLGIREAISNTRTWTTEIENLSAASGSSVPQIQALQGAFRDLGLDTQEVADILQDVQTEVSEALSEGGDKARAFRRLGLSMQEMENNNAAETMRDLIRNINRMSDAEARYQLNQALGEEATRKLMATRRMSASQLQRLNQSMQGQASLSREQRKEMLALQGAVSDLSSNFSELRRRFGSLFAPLATSVVNLTNKVVDLASALVSAGEGWTSMWESANRFFGLDGVSRFLGFEQGQTPEPQSETDQRQTRAVDRRRAESLREYRRELGILQEQLDFEVIDEDTFKEDKLAALVAHFERLQEISADFPSIEFDLEMDLIADQIQQLQDELGNQTVQVDAEFKSRTASGDDFEPTKADGEQSTAKQVRKRHVVHQGRRSQRELGQVDELTRRIDELIRRFNNGTISLSSYRDKLKKVQSRLESLEQPTVSQYRNLQRVNEQLRNTSKSFQVFTQSARAAAFQFGQDFLSVFERSKSLFLGSEKLTDVEKAEFRQREQDLNQSLAQRRITQAEYTAQIAKITKERTELMKSEIDSFGQFFKEIFKSIGQFALNILKQITSQIAAAVAQAAALKTISSVFSLGLGSFGGILGGVLGIGGNLQISGNSRISGQDLVVSFQRTQSSLSRL
jgi:hypothetical protein